MPYDNGAQSFQLLQNGKFSKIFYSKTICRIDSIVITMVKVTKREIRITSLFLGLAAEVYNIKLI
jgi:hypothetical protein